MIFKPRSSVHKAASQAPRTLRHTASRPDAAWPQLPGVICVLLATLGMEAVPGWVLAAPSPDQLAEIPLPVPIPYTPHTWGWTALGALLTIALLACSALRLWRYHQNRYRRDALRRMARLESPRALPELLKRVALSMPGSPSVAALHGQAWQDFLQAHSPQPLPADFSQQLAQLAYGPLPSATMLEQLLHHSRTWVTHHVAT